MRVMWNDFKIVLSMIRSATRRYKPFVAHRVEEILTTIDVYNLRWIFLQGNVADDATRPSTMFVLLHNS